MADNDRPHAATTSSRPHWPAVICLRTCNVEFTSYWIGIWARRRLHFARWCMVRCIFCVLANSRLDSKNYLAPGVLYANTAAQPTTLFIVLARPASHGCSSFACSVPRTVHPSGLGVYISSKVLHRSCTRFFGRRLILALSARPCNFTYSLRTSPLRLCVVYAVYAPVLFVHCLRILHCPCPYAAFVFRFQYFNFAYRRIKCLTTFSTLPTLFPALLALIIIIGLADW
jgi:hypothetical protein